MRYVFVPLFTMGLTLGLVVGNLLPHFVSGWAVLIGILVVVAAWVYGLEGSYRATKRQEAKVTVERKS